MPTDFAPGPAEPAGTSPLFAGETLLDAEKLDCYRLAVEFQALAVRLVPRRNHAELRDQLDRASISIVLNIAFRARAWCPRPFSGEASSLAPASSAATG